MEFGSCKGWNFRRYSNYPRPGSKSGGRYDYICCQHHGLKKHLPSKFGNMGLSEPKLSKIIQNPSSTCKFAQNSRGAWGLGYQIYKPMAIAKLIIFSILIHLYCVYVLCMYNIYIYKYHYHIISLYTIYIYHCISQLTHFSQFPCRTSCHSWQGRPRMVHLRPSPPRLGRNTDSINGGARCPKMDGLLRGSPILGHPHIGSWNSQPVIC